KQIQTGHPKPLKVLWKLYVGATTGAAYKAERKLHRLCSKYKVRGEWFKPECMGLVREFTLKDKVDLVEVKQREHDLLMLEESPL
ncbi:MAG: hypothetical protein KAS32_06565, partial [Candidatus Peribacteraceae bacterium]|nr:hypothetical protein [Candidatus Peribacteraceae bacterium]